MASFTTRVELHHSATKSDYDKLHVEMESEGFSRLIRSDEGRWYHLPTAEYDRSGNHTAAQTLESAKRAASKTGKSFSVLVSESNARTWHNLPEVTAQKAAGWR
jgi:hypothetical protein